MGQRGRKSKQLPLVRGAEPATVDSKSPVTLDAAAKREWDRLLSLLTRQRTLSEAELSTLALHCAALSGIAKCDRSIAKKGFMIPGRHDTEVRNPLLMVRATFVDQAVKTARELGLTPNTRENARVVSEAVEEDPAAKYFKVTG